MKWASLSILLILLGVFIYLMPAKQIMTGEQTMNEFKLKSSAFKEGEMIPSKYTCDGEDVNPLLEIRNVPAEAKSLALIMDDPDASRGVPFDHWIVWNIDPKTQYISEDNLPSNAIFGANSWGKQKYGGPCPQKGKPAHHYVFTLYALSESLTLAQGANKEELLRAMEKHIIAHTSIVGLYGRQ